MSILPLATRCSDFLPSALVSFVCWVLPSQRSSWLGTRSSLREWEGPSGKGVYTCNCPYNIMLVCNIVVLVTLTTFTKRALLVGKELSSSRVLFSLSLSLSLSLSFSSPVSFRLTVQYVADHWVMYKAHRLSCGDTMASLPPDVGHGDPRYSLNRLQLEFDQFVLRATKWILTAHKYA